MYIFLSSFLEPDGPSYRPFPKAWPTHKWMSDMMVLNQQFLFLFFRQISLHFGQKKGKFWEMFFLG